MQEQSTQQPRNKNNTQSCILIWFLHTSGNRPYTQTLQISSFISLYFNSEGERFPHRFFINSG